MAAHARDCDGPRLARAGIGHFDNEIQVDALNALAGVQKIKPQVDKHVFPDGHATFLLAKSRLINLGCATCHPSFVTPDSFRRSSTRKSRACIWRRSG